MRPLSTYLAAMFFALALTSCSKQQEQTPGGAPVVQSGVGTANAAVAPSSTKGNWPCFLGPNRNGFSADAGDLQSWQSAQPAQLWNITMSDNGHSGPSVADGRLYIIDHSGEQDIVRAVDITNGKDLWTFPYPENAREDNGNARTTPTFDNGKLYILSRSGSLFCLDAAKGTKIWARNIQKEFNGRLPQWHYASSPVVDGNKLIIIPGGPNACVAALDKNTGKTIWQGGGSDMDGYGAPVIATINGQKQYVVFTAKNVIGVDANGGRVLWSYPWQTSYDVNAATPVVMGNAVFITSGYGTGCAMLDITAGGAKLRWRNKEMQSHFSTPLAYQGNIYGTTDPGDLVCLDGKTGRALWRQNGFEKGGVVGVGNKLIAMNGGGGDLVLCELSPAGYKELGRINPLGGKSWTAPIATAGMLIVRNQRSLVCLSLK